MADDALQHAAVVMRSRSLAQQHVVNNLGPPIMLRILFRQDKPQNSGLVRLASHARWEQLEADALLASLFILVVELGRQPLPLRLVKPPCHCDAANRKQGSAVSAQGARRLLACLPAGLPAWASLASRARLGPAYGRQTSRSACPEIMRTCKRQGCRTVSVLSL